MNASGSSNPADPLDQELWWWINIWNPVFKDGRFWNNDIPELLDLDSGSAFSYEEIRWIEARTQVVRTLKEAQIETRDFFRDRIVMDIGPGPVGFLEACGARTAIGIEPLANAFHREGLLLAGSDVVYLTAAAENIPLVDDFVDIAVSRNSLDHVTDPGKVIDEVKRVLKAGGSFLVNVDVEHERRPLEPHNFSVSQVDQLLAGFRIDRKIIYDKSHGGEGRMYVALCTRIA